MKLHSVIFFIASLTSGVYASDGHVRSRQNLGHIEENEAMTSEENDQKKRRSTLEEKHHRKMNSDAWYYERDPNEFDEEDIKIGLLREYKPLQETRSQIVDGYDLTVTFKTDDAPRQNRMMLIDTATGFIHWNTTFSKPENRHVFRKRIPRCSSHTVLIVDDVGGDGLLYGGKVKVDLVADSGTSKTWNNIKNFGFLYYLDLKDRR